MSIPHRKSLRLNEYDYSQPGAYFITICTQDRQCSLGQISGEEMLFSPYGEVAAQGWDLATNHFQNINDTYWVVMPNHVHALIIVEASGNISSHTTMGESNVTMEPPIPPQSLLARVVAYYKYQTTKKINLFRNTPGVHFWQRNYYEHIVRSQESMQKIQEYIAANPVRWNEDQLNPSAPPNRFNRR